MSSEGKVWWWPVTAEGEVPDHPPVFVGTIVDDGVSYQCDDEADPDCTCPTCLY